MLYGEDSLRKNLLIFALLILVSGLLFLADNKGILFLKPVLQKPFLVLESPLVSANLAITGFWQFVVDWPAREKEMQAVRNQLLEATNNQGDLNVCLEENSKLKKLLGASLPPKWKFMEARVVGFGPTLHIDRGTSDGIDNGMNVVYENVLVGRVIKANKNDAVVQLVDQPGLKIPVKVGPFSTNFNEVKGGTKARGLLFGQGNNRLLLDKVLQEEKIIKDDYVVASGEEGWLPDVLLGRVDEISIDKTAVYQKATILPLIDYSRLEEVFVVVKS